MNETCIECADDGNNIEWKDGQLICKCDSCLWKEVEDAEQR